MHKYDIINSIVFNSKFSEWDSTQEKGNWINIWHPWHAQKARPILFDNKIQQKLFCEAKKIDVWAIKNSTMRLLFSRRCSIAESSLINSKEKCEMELLDPV